MAWCPFIWNGPKVILPAIFESAGAGPRMALVPFLQRVQRFETASWPVSGKWVFERPGTHSNKRVLGRIWTPLARSFEMARRTACAEFSKRVSARFQMAICPFRKNDLRGGGGHSRNWSERVSPAVYPKPNRTAYVDRELAYKERFQRFRDLCKASGVSCQSDVYV
jgi:hypothetical protein